MITSEQLAEYRRVAEALVALADHRRVDRKLVDEFHSRVRPQDVLSMLAEITALREALDHIANGRMVASLERAREIAAEALGDDNG